MNSLLIELQKTKVTTVSVTEDTLTVDLADGRTIESQKSLQRWLENREVF